MRNYRFLTALTALAVAMELFSDLTAGKMIQVAGQTISITVLYFPVTFILSDVLTEVYGYVEARRVVVTVLCCSILCAALSQGVAYFPSAPGFDEDGAYALVFAKVPRIVAAGWVAVFAGEMLNNRVMAAMRDRHGEQLIALRALLSTVVGQLANTALFYGAAFGGILSRAVLLDSVLSGWLFKVGVEAALLPLTLVVIQALKRAEAVEGNEALHVKVVEQGAHASGVHLN